MSENKHTPEPWQGINDTVCDAQDKTIAHVLTSQYEPDGFLSTDARRIVACVNACRGISTEQLEAVSHFGIVGAQTTDKLALIKQRDDLLAAIEVANGKLRAATMCHPNAVAFLVEEAFQTTEAAIAKVKP